jgi:hypothetical protein
MPPAYFRQYRTKLGFSNQADAKAFFSGKSVAPGIDYGYIADLCQRVRDIITALDKVMYEPFRLDDRDAFLNESIDRVYATVRDAKLLPRLNNQGRRPEQVLFSWLRGYACAQYLLRPIAEILTIPSSDIRLIGDDDLQSVDTFRRTPTADLALTLNGREVRIEAQSGYQGVNDIKQHKVIEAKRQARECGAATIVVHLDLFNGQAAFVRIDDIPDNSVNWITRQQMEGQTVFNIDQNSFQWRIMNAPPPLEALELNLGDQP